MCQIWLAFVHCAINPLCAAGLARQRFHLHPLPSHWTRRQRAGRLARCLPCCRAAISDPRLTSLTAAVTGLHLNTEQADLEFYGRDWTRRWTPAPLAIALPDSVAQVKAVMAWAHANGVAVVPSGGRTGLSGGAVAANGELVLSLERMNKVIEFDRVDRLMTVQAGMALEALHNAAAEHGLI